MRSPFNISNLKLALVYIARSYRATYFNRVSTLLLSQHSTILFHLYLHMINNYSRFQFFPVQLKNKIKIEEIPRIVDFKYIYLTNKKTRKRI